jgi:hypothetical protein
VDRFGRLEGFLNRSEAFSAWSFVLYDGAERSDQDERERNVSEVSLC